MAASLTAKSKFLSMVLRHRPEALGLKLDNNGWVSLSDIIDGCLRYKIDINRGDVDAVIATFEKQRFELSPDGLKIRAVHGHSVSVENTLPSCTPPEMLYHGTARASLSSILSEGVTRQGRRFVHLSNDEKSAREVGLRHGRVATDVIVLTIEAARMAKAGLIFYHSSSGVWLTAHVPVDYIIQPADWPSSGSPIDLE